MYEYIGLDVSLKETAISVRRDGERAWRGKCPSDPRLLAEVIRKRAPQAKRVVFEIGPLSVWFLHALSAEGLPAICIDARHAKAALDMAANKTDANDTDGLAHLAEVGFFREVRVKGYDSMLVRTLVATRPVRAIACGPISSLVMARHYLGPAPRSVRLGLGGRCPAPPTTRRRSAARRFIVELVGRPSGGGQLAASSRVRTEAPSQAATSRLCAFAKAVSTPSNSLAASMGLLRWPSMPQARYSATWCDMVLAVRAMIGVRWRPVPASR